jgi:uncharacterized protein (DUF2384 family)
MMNAAERAFVECELRELFDIEQAQIWLNSPHPLLGLRRPRDCNYDEVMAHIDQLKSGAYT